MKKPRFTTTTTPPKTRWDGGCLASGQAHPSRWADELYGASIPGTRLLAYMIRRFGWPNVGSDGVKDLCAWCLTTPIEGLYLTVQPYLGHETGDMPSHGCGNLHFGLRYTRAVEVELDRDIEREKYWRLRERAIRKWWDEEGGDLYIFGTSTTEEDKEQLVRKCFEKDGQVSGLYKRPKGQKRQKMPKKVSEMFFWWMTEFLREAHPSVVPDLKRMGARKPTAFQRRARAAIETVLKDLLRPVRVRDIVISPFGDVERDETAKKLCAGQPEAEPFEGAGYAPEYWYSPRRKRDAAKKRQAGEKTE